MSKKLHEIPVKIDTQTVELYQPHQKIYPRWVLGLFQKWRIFFVVMTQLVYFGTPWLTWNNKQAVLWDLNTQQFTFWNITILPQDFVYLAALLLLSAFGLFTWTTVAGRLWCGYSCPQTVYTQIMLWIEEWIEGNYTQRKKRDASSNTWDKILRKTASHSIMLLFSLWTGITLLCYFVPTTTVMAALPSWDFSFYEGFWILFYAGFTYLFASHMREQVCQYMCPYARFQSVMFDRDTLVVSYDYQRGEPRGKKKKDDIDSKGDCINCGICVQVCPAGIDIRNGLQYECIGCGLCADGCDEVMDKIGRPRGLIRYTTEAVLDGQYTDQEWFARLKRPRVVMYAVILGLVFSITTASFIMRNSFKVDIIKDRATLVRETQDGQLENVYQAHIMNVTTQMQHFTIMADGLEDIHVVTEPKQITVKPGKMLTVIVNVRVNPEHVRKGANPIQFVIQSKETHNIEYEESTFIGD